MPRVVELPMSPPNRLIQSLRFRSSKIRYDQDVWGQCMQPVSDLLSDGWRVAHVHVEWGAREPATPALRERMTRELTRCDADCTLTESMGKPGRGDTVIRLEREP